MRARRRYAASIAIGLSVLVGFVIPLGDAAPSIAVSPDGTDLFGNPSDQPGPSNGPVPDDTNPDVQTPEVPTPDAPSTESGPPAQETAPPADPETEVPETEDPTPDAETTPEPESTQGAKARAEVAPFAAEMLQLATDERCSFANPGTGAYAQSLCWLDLAGFTTAYEEASRSTARNGTGTRPYSFTTTITARSQLGVAYGTVTVSGTATSNTQSNAEKDSVTAAQNNLSAQLHLANGVLYGPVTNYPLSIPLSESYEFTANLSISSAAGGRALAVQAAGFPTWSGAFLGNNNFYTGVDGMPALYQISDSSSTTAQSTTTATLSNIQLKDGQGARVADFAVVVADAESTDNGESISWSHANGKGFKWLPNNPAAFDITNAGQRKTAVVGNACNATSTNQFPRPDVEASTRDCTAGSSGQASPKTGTAMLQIAPLNTTSNFQVTQAMLGSGRQAVAFGIILGGAKVTVNVADRVLNANGAPSTAAFVAALARSGGSTSTAATGTVATTATTGSQYVPINPNNASQLSFSSSVSGASASSYAVGWVCLRSVPNSTTPIRWPVTGSSLTPPTGTNALVKGGEFLDCTVTYTPPYLTLVKSVNNGATGATNVPSDFTLTATGPVSVSSAPGGPALKRAVAIDNYALTETLPSGPAAWQFGYEWSNLACAANTGSTARGAFTRVQDPVTSVVTAGTLQIVAGNDVTCTYTNRANQPELVVKKESNPPSGEPVDAGQTVTYTLTFDNSLGTAASTVDYLDHLKDVLDDATVVQGSVRYGDGNVAPASTDPFVPGIAAASVNASQQIAITGTVPARKIRTMSFTVTVKANETDAPDRQSSTAPLSGYTLRNFLTKAADPVPESCSPTSPSQPAVCTENPIRAWAVRKDSQPESGAVVHVGGTIYYRVKVTNVRGETITGVKLKDDLTQTLSATVWDPQAASVLPATYGVSYYGGAAGDTLLQSTPYDVNTGPKPIFTGSAAFDPSFPGGSPFPGGKWTFEPPAFDIPAQIGGQAVAYAIVGYAVRGGSVADPANARLPFEAAGMPVKALPNAVWVNTVQADKATIAGKLVAPNRCSGVGGDIAPGDTGTNSDCKTLHRLGDSYFHVWKKTSDSTTGPNNSLTGSSFVLADTEVAARNGEASRWLCRKEYEVLNPNSALSEPAFAVGTVTGGTLDFGERSDTHQSIAVANLNRAAYNAQQGLFPGRSGYRPQLAQCGQFFYLSAASEGQAAGSWRAKDVLGGDTVNGGAGSLPNWRNASGFNNGIDATAGRHGTYWLGETISPSNHELLAQPVQMWVAPSAPSPSGQNLGPADVAWYDYQGRLSLPVLGLGEGPGAGQGMGGGSEIRKQCGSPSELPANRQAACVMPSGWTMPIFDVKLKPLPMTGGHWTTALSGGGGVVLLVALGGVLWWRRRRDSGPSIDGEAY